MPLTPVVLFYINSTSSRNESFQRILLGFIYVSLFQKGMKIEKETENESWI